MGDRKFCWLTILVVLNFFNKLFLNKNFLNPFFSALSLIWDKHFFRPQFFFGFKFFLGPKIFCTHNFVSSRLVGPKFFFEFTILFRTIILFYWKFLSDTNFFLDQTFTLTKHLFFWPNFFLELTFLCRAYIFGTKFFFAPIFFGTFENSLSEVDRWHFQL